MKHILLKLLVSAPLAVALYHATACPCEVYLKCHKEQYFIALAAAAVIPILAYPSLLVSDPPPLPAS